MSQVLRSVRTVLILVCLFYAALAAAQETQPPAPPTTPPAPASPDATAPAAPAKPAQEANGDTAIVLAAGDIAKCEILGGAQGTARILDRNPVGTVITLGDNAYDAGTPEQFEKCYGPTWGRHKARTRPAPGNHDFAADANGKAYYDYFGESAGPPGKGWYSFDLAGWHIISLNSFIAVDKKSPQGQWLQADLEAHPSDCILAYWHIPLFSSGPHGSDPRIKELWKMLYAAGADIIVNGHDHDYERFAPQDADGKADPAKGIREFVVGTGGGGVYKFKTTARNSEVKDNSTYGVLKLTLGPGKYDWEFIPTSGQTFTDKGSGTCTPR